jgi:hypothetical protein
MTRTQPRHPPGGRLRRRPKQLTRAACLPAVVVAAITLGAGTATAQGPGVDNPGPNVGNFGICVITQALLPGVISPSEFATSEDPGVFIERGEDDFFEPKPGFACSVGFQGPGGGRP